MSYILLPKSRLLGCSQQEVISDTHSSITWESHFGNAFSVYSGAELVVKCAPNGDVMVRNVWIGHYSEFFKGMFSSTAPFAKLVLRDTAFELFTDRKGMHYPKRSSTLRKGTETVAQIRYSLPIGLFFWQFGGEVRAEYSRQEDLPFILVFCIYLWRGLNEASGLG